MRIDSEREHLSPERKKQKTRYICQSCGYESAKWLGRCTECSAWGSFIEEVVVAHPSQRSSVSVQPLSRPIKLSSVESHTDRRLTTSSAEFDRVLGGGIVPGSVVLIGGEPGIGKSTLMLQQGIALAKRGQVVLYVSGEESPQQTKMRADRLAVSSEQFYLLPETNLDAILNAIDEVKPALVVIDSIQTTFKPAFESAPGSISQVRECALELITLAKKSSTVVFIIGHVTKEGYVAGPKTLEHMVDTLLLFEGDRDHLYRILRAVKNRFGSTREIGVFEMTQKGLDDVGNPSALFLSERYKERSGSAVTCILEGTRPILVELQALVAPTSYGVPQRTTSGIDHRRVSLLLAVLDKRVGLHLSTYDVFVNVAGGVRIEEPAVDLGIIASVTSSLKNRIVDSFSVMVGEVGLGGEIRGVSHIESRIAEAEKMGFKRVIIPASNNKRLRSSTKVTIIGVEDVESALDAVVNEDARRSK